MSVYMCFAIKIKRCEIDFKTENCPIFLGFFLRNIIKLGGYS